MKHIGPRYHGKPRSKRRRPKPREDAFTLFLRRHRNRARELGWSTMSVNAIERLLEEIP